MEDEDEDDGRTKIGPSPVELWDALMPRYPKKHYSLNAGVGRCYNTLDLLKRWVITDGCMQ